jgi:hypothetical protein
VPADANVVPSLPLLLARADGWGQQQHLCHWLRGVSWCPSDGAGRRCRPASQTVHWLHGYSPSSIGALASGTSSVSIPNQQRSLVSRYAPFALLTVPAGVVSRNQL